MPYGAVSVFDTVNASGAGVFFGDKVGELVGWVDWWIGGLKPTATAFYKNT